jgi:hypothetical protein
MYNDRVQLREETEGSVKYHLQIFAFSRSFHCKVPVQYSRQQSAVGILTPVCGCCGVVL